MGIYSKHSQYVLTSLSFESGVTDADTTRPVFPVYKRASVFLREQTIVEALPSGLSPLYVARQLNLHGHAMIRSYLLRLTGIESPVFLDPFEPLEQAYHNALFIVLSSTLPDQVMHDGLTELVEAIERGPLSYIGHLMRCIPANDPSGYGRVLTAHQLLDCLHEETMATLVERDELGIKGCADYRGPGRNGADDLHHRSEQVH